MKEIDKLKCKIKRTKWLVANLNKVILGIYTPLMLLNMIFLPIFPIFAIACMGVGFLSTAVLGYIYLLRYDDTEYLHLLEKQLTAAETVDAEKLDVLTKSLEKYKSNEMMVKDKQTTKRLIKDLIKIKASAEKALNEQNQAEIIENQDENSICL